jgi:predicted component of type VI protein secretion system
LLDHLRAEEALLGRALTVLTDLHAAVRGGDLSATEAARPPLDEITAATTERRAARDAAAAELAAAVGLPPEHLTLSALADRLPGPAAGELRAARDRLARLADELAACQRRNANLICYLRSFFRGALAGTADPPARYYGRTGAAIHAPW